MIHKCPYCKYETCYSTSLKNHLLRKTKCSEMKTHIESEDPRIKQLIETNQKLIEDLDKSKNEIELLKEDISNLQDNFQNKLRKLYSIQKKLEQTIKNQEDKLQEKSSNVNQLIEKN